MSEINITLPDNSVRSYKSGSTGLDIAASIGKSLARDALAIKVNGELIDLTRPINDNANIAIITPNSEEGLELLRHDAAHILAQAVKELYPETQVTIGPAIENGFFYDFAREKPFTLDDLPVIEAKMHEISKKAYELKRMEWTRNDAIEYFTSIGEDYKAEIIRDIPEDQILSIYQQGDFIDLCRGPHAPTTAHTKFFKLMKVAGAYWRGDSNNAMLSRIYGTAWATQKQLDDYLHMLEEAEKRDHRKIGHQLGLFHFQEEAPGMVFWHDKGWTLYRTVENYVREKIQNNGYVEVKTPVLVDRSLWEASGHWEKFRGEMFVVEAEHKTFCLKPMNCPCHVQIFKQGLKSYKDLPIRMAEFGNCHRNETSGAMHGLMRVRSMVQDDAHIFCTEDQIESETERFVELLKEVYKDFGFTEFNVKFSDRPEIRAGSDETWDKAETALRHAIAATGIECAMNKGEGAFYGPKLEFVLKDAIGRDWQCGTLQVDLILPERLDATYIGADGQKYRPVMLHRAILGSLERFIGVLIESYVGKFPLWLSPVQVVVASISEEVSDYARAVYERMRKEGFRAELDNSGDKITYKIREHMNAKVPYMLIVGKKEQENNSVSIRKIDLNDQESMGLEEFIAMFANQVKLK